MNPFLEYRMKAGITQKEAAHIAGTSLRSYNTWERQPDEQELSNYQIAAYAAMTKIDNFCAVDEYCTNVQKYRMGLATCNYHVIQDLDVTWGVGIPSYKIPIIGPRKFCTGVLQMLKIVLSLLERKDAKAAKYRIKLLIKLFGGETG